MILERKIFALQNHFGGKIFFWTQKRENFERKNLETATYISTAQSLNIVRG